MVEHFPFGIFGFDWRLHRGHGMTRGGSLMILPFAVWSPLEFLAKGVEELAEWETVTVKFEVEDVEFEEDCVKVVRLVVNPP